MSHRLPNQQHAESRRRASFASPPVTRRDFMRGTAVAALAPALLTTGGDAARAARAAQGGITLTVNVSSDYQPIVQSFANQYQQATGNKVNIVAQAYNQTHDKIASGLASGAAAYDIVAVDVVWTAEFAAAGFIAPLDDRITPELQEQLVPAALVSRSYNGSIYQWPLFTMKYLYYNAAMLAAAGFEKPPTTWEEFTEMSKAIQEQGVAQYGTAWAMVQAEGLICDYVLLVEAFGGEFQDAEGKWILNQGGGVTALQFMVDSLTTAGTASPSSTTLDDRTNRNLFAAGEVPFLLNWTSAYKQFTDPGSSKVVDDVRIGLIPGSAAAGTVSASTTGGSGFGIAAKSPNQDAAWDFIQMMIVDPEAQRRWLAEANQIPTQKALYDDPAIVGEYPQFADMRRQMDFGVGRPELPWYGQWTQVMQLELHRALTGEKTPQQALDDAMEQVNAIQEDFS
jgi:multiple sugar transport system substrate-binding protein